MKGENNKIKKMLKRKTAQTREEYMQGWNRAEKIKRKKKCESARKTAQELDETMTGNKKKINRLAKTQRGSKTE